MNYGLPYLGSKSRIAEKVVSTFPKRKNLYDLFCGGCAITDYCMRNNLFENYIINDVNSQCMELFIKALNGEFKNETRWISREDFFKLKEKDSCVSFVWSFGNNNKTYMYSPQIEPYKKACHYAIVFDDWSLLENLCPEIINVAKKALKNIKDVKERRLKFGPSIVKELKRLNDWNLIQNNPLYKSCHWRGGKLDGKNNDLQSLQSLERLERLQSLQSLESLERLQSLQSLERLERLESLESLERFSLNSFNKSYDEIEIEENSLIYCDIPYFSTATYKGVDSFDYEKFYNWCKEQKELVIVSEYYMPEDRFICVKEIEHNSTYKGGGGKKVVEKVFVPKHQIELYYKLKKESECDIFSM